MGGTSCPGLPQTAPGDPCRLGLSMSVYLGHFETSWDSPWLSGPSLATYLLCKVYTPRHCSPTNNVEMGMDTSFGSLLVHDSVATLTASDGVTWTDLVLSVALCHLDTRAHVGICTVYKRLEAFPYLHRCTP